MPQVSVIVPAFNPGRVLDEAIVSVVEQTHRDWELLVVDDGSVEDLSWVNGVDPRVRIHHTTNRGVSAARNTGIAATTGEIVAFLDQDDRWRPTKLERQLEQLSDDVDFSYTDFDLIDGQGAPLGSGYGRDVGYLDMLAGELGVLLSSLIVKRDALARVGTFSPMFSIQQDLELILRLARTTRASFVDSVQVDYRRHDAAASTDYRRAAKELLLLYDMHEIAARSARDRAAIEALAKGRQRVRRTYAFQALDAAREALHTQDEYGAARALWRSLRLSPTVVARSSQRWVVGRLGR